MSSTGAVIELEQQSERRARLMWGGLIAGFFVVQFSMSMVAIVLATSDPTHAVIPNYHQQAMEHDKILSERQASERLGWKWKVYLETPSSSSPVHSFTVEIKNAQDRPVEMAQVSVELWHHARGNQRQQVRLTPVGHQTGLYRGQARLGRTGVWQIDLNVIRDGERFVDRQEKFWRFSS